jgi:hypothetical protein
VLETEPWYEYSSYGSWRRVDSNRFRPVTGGYGQSRNGVLVAKATTYGTGMTNRTWQADIVQLSAIKHLVCPADGDLALTLQALENKERERKAAQARQENERARRYNATQAHARKVVGDAGLQVVEGYTTADWVSPAMGKVKVYPDGSFATVQMRVTDLEKLLALVAERDLHLHQLEGV